MLGVSDRATHGLSTRRPGPGTHLREGVAVIFHAAFLRPENEALHWPADGAIQVSATF